MYKQYKDYNGNVYQNAIIRTTDGATIPFDPANTDYAEFKKAVTDGAELQDASGEVMSQADAEAFVKTLP